MMSLISSLILCLLFPITRSAWPHVYSREHFTDIIAPPENPNLADKNGILVLYAPECEYMLTLKELHMDHHLVYMTHDYKTAPDHIWYKYRDEDDLQKKYGAESCFSALYFEKGQSLDLPSDVWSAEKESLVTWVWSHLKHVVKIVNDLSEDVIVMQEPMGGGPVVKNVVVGKNRAEDITTYLSYTIRATKTDYVTPVFAAVVLQDNPVIKIRKPRVVDITPYRDQDNDDLHFWYRWVESHADRIMRTFKQPLIVHNYTEKGYTKMKMPDDAFQIITDFYESGKANRDIEDFYKADAVIENSEAKTTMVELTEDMKMRLEKIILPILEDYCNCELKRTSIYGIREYYKGHVLRNHVDRIKTHAIGAILQVDQDLDGEEDWLLEVIEYNGERKHVSLQIGEMLVYEASKLIHGRPKALQGKWYANAFMHYAPVSGWDYEYTNTAHFKSVIHNVNEPLHQFYTQLTKEKEIFKYQLHDEL